MNDAPDRVYLQVGPDCTPEEMSGVDWSEVTWTRDRVYETDIEYVRAIQPGTRAGVAITDWYIDRFEQARRERDAAVNERDELRGEHQKLTAAINAANAKLDRLREYAESLKSHDMETSPGFAANVAGTGILAILDGKGDSDGA